ncbi:hypothetical protein BU25DRAFT_406619 [Macroventuria anomochaeta]|uniref:Uncharacterized protein n=1 Tax=Macroventuria anomochaeta TaxID=301207 RepID=A0ACB6SDN8_9PLEO|nr:uncharacterized protein BU25DRAFT_406619 [Macroventuria anomochaeta]KAF2632102.1 hypothetical protein BU25DRAFT_406619 [Macroventuria anomochaeta]
MNDDFLDGTVLASTSKGKSKAKVTSDSDDSLPEPPAEPSTQRTKRSRNGVTKDRAPSSSPPPPLADYALPYSEPMRKGISEFDLRDDEWMMVEDEFLETAKLFTRHLHIAEYDRLKESIEAKKKEAEIARPVIAGSKRSVEGAMKERAKVQDSKQKKAIRDVFASQGDSIEDDTASYWPRSSKTLAAMPQPATNGSQDTDSDDLDAPHPPKSKAPAPTSSSTASSLRVTRPLPASPYVSKPLASSFAKPALPAPTVPARSRARPSRMTPFDMLDEYTPPTFDTSTPPAAAPHERQTFISSKPRSQSTSSSLSSPQTSQITTTKAIKPRRSLDLLDDWASSKDNGGISREVADRIAKRKAERAEEGEGKEKRKATNLDDIPTFLF